MIAKVQGDTPMSNRLQIPVEQSIRDRIEVLAKQAGIPMASLVRKWVVDRLAVEEREVV